MKVEKSFDSINVLIITLVGKNFNFNYGAFLQAYATQKLLDKHGFKVKILDYEPYEPMESSVSLTKRFKSYLSNHGIFKTIIKMFNAPKEKIRKNIRKKNFITFGEQYLFFTEKTYHSYESIKNDSNFIKDSFECFLVGSDQVWSPNAPTEQMLRVYLLDFIHDSKKISYASSISNYIPYHLRDLYKNALSEFKHISVREEGSAKEIEKILGYKPVVNIDPTLLIDVHYWQEIAKKPDENIDKPYIFVYDLYRSNEILEVVEKVAKHQNIKYVNFTPISFFKKLRYRHLQYNYYTNGPSEFLWLIKESDFVITSSFHGVLFSLIFSKPFYAILWNVPDKMRQNDRIIDILEKVGLRDRCFTDPEKILERELDCKIDWESVYEKLEELRRKSSNWLLEALRK